MSILFNFVFIALLAPLFSVSAPPSPYVVGQPNGSKIPVQMYGHEYYNWIETEDGYVIDFVEDDTRLGWYYSDLDSHGKFYPTYIPVEYPAPISLDIPKHLREIFPEVRNIRHSPPHLVQNSINLKRSTLPSIFKPLVFLVDFNNLPNGMPERIYHKNQFQHLLFDTDLDSDAIDLPSSYNMSVRDYYNEISNGKLDIYGDSNSIVDWHTVDHEYSYYVDNAQGTGQGDNGSTHSAAALVVEIAMEIQTDTDINFNDFDGNEDGFVDLIILIVEGWSVGDNDQFWPHMSIIPSSLIEDFDFDNDGLFEFDNVAINKYIVIPEQFHRDNYGASKNDIHPIGTICHEIGHALGLPDLYDTKNIVNVPAGIGEWGLMGSGNWQRQTSPAYMSAWSRYQLGFIDPLIIEDVINEDNFLLPAEMNGMEYTAMILPMDSNMPQEYLILENRQQRGSDKYLEKSGLLVWHIDETIAGMYPALNSVNVNPYFYGVNLLQADGNGDLYTVSGSADSGDPFPGSTDNKNITNLTYPNVRTYSYDRDADGNIDLGKDSGIEINNIIEDIDSLLIFNVTNPNKWGKILGYDEGGYNGLSYDDSYSYLQWAGIKISAVDTALLSGVQTVFPPSFWSWDVTDYTLNIWEGWSNNKPERLLYQFGGNVQWHPEDFRDGGWVYISTIDENILWNALETYFVEINFNGIGGVYPFDQGLHSNSESDNMSYFRSNIDDQCNPLTAITDGDWNIRAVISGADVVTGLSTELPKLPYQHLIYSNYPNPFNLHTILPVYLASPSDISYRVVDVLGRQITHRNVPFVNTGYHEFYINMSHASSGVYFYQFTIDEKNYTSQKMLLLK